MGWSELTARPEVHKIFKKLKRKYTLRRVNVAGQAGPTIQILHEGTLTIPTIRDILDLFPDHIFVDFVPDTIFNPEDEGDTYEFRST